MTLETNIELTPEEYENVIDHTIELIEGITLQNTILVEGFEPVAKLFVELPSPPFDEITKIKCRALANMLMIMHDDFSRNALPLTNRLITLWEQFLKRYWSAIPSYAIQIASEVATCLEPTEKAISVYESVRKQTQMFRIPLISKDTVDSYDETLDKILSAFMTVRDFVKEVSKKD